MQSISIMQEYDTGHYITTNIAITPSRDFIWMKSFVLIHLEPKYY